MATRTTKKTVTIGQIDLDVTIETIIEVVTLKQIVQERPVDYLPAITSTRAAGEIGIREIGDDSREVLLVAALNTKNEINALHRVFTGSLNVSTAHPREIFQTAIMNNAARIMMWHCHPSGSCDPSEADLVFTRKMAQAGELLSIELLDHIIISGKEYLSLKEYGIL